LTLRSVS